MYHNVYLILPGDYDAPCCVEVLVGLDRYKRFYAAIIYEDYEDERYCCETRAVAKAASTRHMARRNNVTVDQLPAFVADCLSEWHSVVNPTRKQSIDCFKEIVDCMLDEGCRIKIQRTYGPRGFMVC